MYSPLLHPGTPLAELRPQPGLEGPASLPPIGLPPSSLQREIGAFLRVANFLQDSRPRVSYLCRLYAMQRATEVDPYSVGQEVLAFRFSLWSRLQVEGPATAHLVTGGRTDRELLHEAFKATAGPLLERVKGTGNVKGLADPLEACSVLFQMLSGPLPGEPVDSGTPPGAPVSVPADLLMLGRDLLDLVEMSGVTFNIVPLHQLSRPSSHQKLDEGIILPEVRAAYLELFRQTKNLPRPPAEFLPGGKDVDVFDWAASIFGFQPGNVDNQRENVLMMLANAHAALPDARSGGPDELDPRVVKEVSEKTLSNYRSWLRYLGKKEAYQGFGAGDDGQKQLLLCVLYWLIWGEAANVRFLPECLCYIFHHMAGEMAQRASREWQGGAQWRPRWLTDVRGGTFLSQVIQPVYDILAAEAHNAHDTSSRPPINGNRPHTAWRNYDDMNEFFWTRDCFKLKWPWRTDANYFVPLLRHKPTQQEMQAAVEAGQGQKVYKKAAWGQHGYKTALEKRSWLMLIRAFDRFVALLVVSFQGLVIVALSRSNRVPAQPFDRDGDEVISEAEHQEWLATSERRDYIWEPHMARTLGTCVITYAVLSGLQALIDIYANLEIIPRFIQTWRGWLRLFNLLLHAAWHAGWSFVLIWFYIDMMHKTHLSQGGVYHHDTLVADAIFGGLCALYVVPPVALALLRSFHCFVVMMDWMASHLPFSILFAFGRSREYVARTMGEPFGVVLLYSIFWVILLACKLTTSYYLQIQPLTWPTRQVWGFCALSYSWIETRSDCINLAFVLSMWLPTGLVFILDTFIWYTVLSTMVGAAIGLKWRMGEIHNFSDLRDRFEALPRTFCNSLLPKKTPLINRMRPSNELLSNSKAVDSKHRVDPLLCSRVFAQLWNEFIDSMREEDLLSNKEAFALCFPLSSVGKLSTVQWPIFLLAGQFHRGIDLAAKHSDRAWGHRHIGDGQPSYMKAAMLEVFECTFNILEAIILPGTSEILYIKAIRDAVVSSSTKWYNMSGNFQLYNLPKLQAKLLSFLSTLIKAPIIKPEDLADLNDSTGSLSSTTPQSAFRNALVRSTMELFETVLRHVLTSDLRSHLQEEGRLPIALSNGGGDASGRHEMLFAGTSPCPVVNWPPLAPVTCELIISEATRLHAIITSRSQKESEPRNPDAKRRLMFFTNSLFMDMPETVPAARMLPLSVLTPYYNEIVIYSKSELHKENEDGVSTIYYLQTVFPDDWANFLERMGKSEEELWALDDAFEIRLWASYRGQTLARTVRGMMYHQRAIQIAAFLDAQLTDSELAAGAGNVRRRQSVGPASAPPAGVLLATPAGTRAFPAAGPTPVGPAPAVSLGVSPARAEIGPAVLGGGWRARTWDGAVGTSGRWKGARGRWRQR
eukprot:jgi/Mesvir1/12231/Mv00453-RA.1